MSPAECNLTPIHSEDPGIPPGGLTAGHHGSPRYETQLHQAKGRRPQVQGLRHPGLPLLEIGEGKGQPLSPVVGDGGGGVRPSPFLRTNLQIASVEIPS